MVWPGLSREGRPVRKQERHIGCLTSRPAVKNEGFRSRRDREKQATVHVCPAASVDGNTSRRPEKSVSTSLRPRVLKAAALAHCGGAARKRSQPGAGQALVMPGRRMVASVMRSFAQRRNATIGLGSQTWTEPIRSGRGPVNRKLQCAVLLTPMPAAAQYPAGARRTSSSPSPPRLDAARQDQWPRRSYPSEERACSLSNGCAIWDDLCIAVHET